MTEKDLPSLLRSLRETAPKLNKTTDEANLAIRLVEDFLASLSLGIPALVVMSREKRAVSEDGDSVHYEHLLSLHYRKHGNTFRLLLEESDLYPEDDEEREEILSTTPLAEAGRHDKLRAVAEIPDLLSRIVAEANAVQADAAKAVTAVDQLVAALAAESPTRLNPVVSAHLLRQRAEMEKPVSKK